MTGSRKRPRVRFAAMIAALAAGFALSSCGGGSDEPSGPGTTPSGSSSSPAEPDASTSTGDSVVAEINGAQLQAPAGWSVSDEDGLATLTAPKDELGYAPGSAILNADVTLAGSTEELADTRLRGAKSEGFTNPERLADAEFAGVTFFHIRAKRGTKSSYDLYGAVIDGSEVVVAWEFIIEFADRKEADAMINEVMPTFKFNG